jgi:peptidyl-dipeptidase Dcp
MDTAHSTLPIIADILALRREQAALMGYANYAQYALADTMAGTPAAVATLLNQVWPAAARRAREEYAALAPYARKDGLDTIEAWDWRYYAEKMSEDQFAISDAAVKPYFSLAAMTQAMFDCADKLFGLQFKPQSGIPLYHPDVHLYEVRKRGSDAIIALFLADNFARPSKRSGAWMSYFREQSRIQGEIIPIVVNTNNFPKPLPGQAALLGFDEVRTLFHEFGHGLHGMLSNSSYQRLGGTNVLQDFVELPSQLFEHWAFAPQVLKAHAKHVDTGEAIPDDLITKLQRANSVNQGLEAVESSASVLVDLALHQETALEGLDLMAFERKILQEIGLPPHMKPRHELPHFGHLFSGDSYASKYYVYLWAEVLDADAFEAFTERGDPFDAGLADKLYRHIYSAGNTVAPQVTYRAFRGRDPAVEPMLRKKGLLAA